MVDSGSLKGGDILYIITQLAVYTTIDILMHVATLCHFWTLASYISTSQHPCGIGRIAIAPEMLKVFLEKKHSLLSMPDDEKVVSELLGVIFEVVQV